MAKKKIEKVLAVEGQNSQTFVLSKISGSGKTAAFTPSHDAGIFYRVPATGQLSELYVNITSCVKIDGGMKIATRMVLSQEGWRFEEWADLNSPESLQVLPFAKVKDRDNSWAERTLSERKQVVDLIAKQIEVAPINRENRREKDAELDKMKRENEQMRLQIEALIKQNASILEAMKSM